MINYVSYYILLAYQSIQKSYIHHKVSAIVIELAVIGLWFGT